MECSVVNNKNDSRLTLNKALARICFAVLASLIVGLIAFASLAAGQETKRVFVLNSYHRGYHFMITKLEELKMLWANRA